MHNAMAPPSSIFTKYRDLQRMWRWRLVAKNGRIIADSGEGYHHEADCDHGIALVKASFNSPTSKG